MGGIGNWCETGWYFSCAVEYASILDLSPLPGRLAPPLTLRLSYLFRCTCEWARRWAIGGGVGRVSGLCVVRAPHGGSTTFSAAHW
jgi:hypothetical protein